MITFNFFKETCKRSLWSLTAILGLGMMSGSTLDGAVQNVSITVGVLNHVTLSGATVSLDSARGGYTSDGVVEVYDQSATFDLTSNQTNKKLVASLNQEMPEGVELYLRITGGNISGQGNIRGAYSLLGTTTADLITGMSNYTIDDGILDFKMVVNEQASPITQNYTLSLVVTSG